MVDPQPESHRHSVQQQPPVPDRVRLPLLTLITQQSLDEDYLVAAESRVSGARPLRTASRNRTLLVAAIIGLFGLLVSTAFVQTRRSADADDANRRALIERVEARRDRVRRLEERSARLNTRTAALSKRLTSLVDTENDVAGENRRLGATAGFVATTGSGVRVTVDQPPGVDLKHGVQDSDLALLVNGLWSAGARAVAVNGQRITARTAIRFSGVAILVNKIGVSAPFVVTAIGDEDSLQARFAETSSGQLFTALAAQYGYEWGMQNVNRLTLNAGPPAFLDVPLARQPDTDTGDDPRLNHNGRAGKPHSRQQHNDEEGTE